MQDEGIRSGIQFYSESGFGMEGLVKVVSAVLLAVSVLSAIACTGGTSELATTPSEPTTDVQGMVDAGIRGTQQAEAALDATVEARVVTTLTTANQTAAPIPTNTPWPTDTPWPTATPYPIPTPWPTNAPWPTEMPYPTAMPYQTPPSPPPSPRSTRTPRPTAMPYPTAAPYQTPTPRPPPTLRPAQTARPASTQWPTPTQWPTLTPRPTSTPRPSLTPRPTLRPGERLSLRQYAARHAGGPGAIYVGDLSQLVGPAPAQGLGDANDNVPLEYLEQNRHIFETDYYRSLLDRANLTDPQPLVSNGEKFRIRYACVDRELLPCKLQIVYFVENVRERTKGQIDLNQSQGGMCICLRRGIVLGIRQQCFGP